MPDDQAGRVGRCPRCKSKVIVPPATGAQNKPALRDLLDLSAPPQAPPAQNHAEEPATSEADRDQPTSVVVDPLAEVIEESRFPWFLDALAYPVSSSGAVNVAVFAITPWFVAFLVRLLTRFLQSVLPGAGYLMTFLKVPVYIVFACYVCTYVAHCVTDSSRGHRRASDLQIEGALSFGDLLSQTILLVACVAIACWPVAVYYVLTERTDTWYWLLGACGVFFLPMSFLAGVIFGSFDALNPLLIVQSIGRTLVPYCGLVLFFLAIAGLAAAVLPRLPIWPFLRLATQIYLLLVLANSVGRFYWHNRERLDWGV
jgi:hypothetical protein